MVELHKKKIIAISGLSGFVGTNLENYLDGAHTIRSLSRNLLSKIESSKLKSCSSVVHLAGKAHDLKIVSAPEQYYTINYELSKKLYDAFLLSDAKKFIFISSVKASTDQVDGILKESHGPYPQTHYGKSKLMAEKYIQSQPLPESKELKLETNQVPNWVIEHVLQPLRFI